LPRDIIAYRLLSWSVVLLILFKHYLKSIPVLQLTAEYRFSHQFIYGVINTFNRFREYIFLFFRQSDPQGRPASSNRELLEKINAFNPKILFQLNYMAWGRRPCFMCKFLGLLNPPYISIRPP